MVGSTLKMKLPSSFIKRFPLTTLFDCMLLSCHVRVSDRIYTLKLPECQGTSCSKQKQYLKLSNTRSKYSEDTRAMPEDLKVIYWPKVYLFFKTI